MSIEDKLQYNTNALNRLAEILEKMGAWPLVEAKGPLKSYQLLGEEVTGASARRDQILQGMGATPLEGSHQNALGVEMQEAEKLKEHVYFYEQGKATIKKLALNHRDEIKKLNASYGIERFSDMLVDPNDLKKGVKDFNVLQAYLEALSFIDYNS